MAGRWSETKPLTYPKSGAIFEVKDGDFTEFSAYVKWDGCIDLVRCYADGDADTLHICDLDDLIALLTELREKAKAHFGQDWPTP